MGRQTDMEDVYILAIESSCDETAAAVVKNGREVLSNVIYSQIDLHTVYGGVVPEIASRKHIEKINTVITKALADAGMKLGEMSAIAVTYGPGLVGALLVGVAEAKAISFASGIPLVGVHHIEGHIAANYIEHKELEPPYMGLIVSGGHTHLVMVEDYDSYRIIGRTHDDAAGEAFDKVARAIGLGYPGGPKIDKAAKQGNPEKIAFPRANLKVKPSNLHRCRSSATDEHHACGKVHYIGDSPYDFSFSGLKSAVLNYLNSCRMKQGLADGSVYENKAGRDDFSCDEIIDTETGATAADVAASFQAAVVDVLVGKTMDAASEFGVKTVAIAGGVASNSALREGMKKACEARGLKLYFPSPILCTDNAAMIGAAAYYEFSKGVRSGLDLNAVPNLKLGER